MKYVSNERGAFPILVIVLLVLVAVAVGIAVFNVSNSRNKGTQSASASPVASSSPVTTGTPAPSPKPGSDEALVVTAVEAHCNAAGAQPGSPALSSYQQVGVSVRVNVHCAGTLSGSMDYLSKINGVWTVIFTGQEPPGKDIGLRYGLPTGWYDPNRP
jgi:hypothetical protein